MEEFNSLVSGSIVNDGATGIFLFAQENLCEPKISIR